MYKWIFSNQWPLGAFLVICLISSAVGDVAEAAPTPHPSGNTTITASKMTVRNQENKAIFEGTVKLTKGTLVVHSDVMVVFFKPADAANQKSEPPKAAKEMERMERASRSTDDLPIMSNRSVSMIEATGRVRIEKEDGRATCQKAVYHGDEEKIVLTGTPVAWQKGTRVTGKKITMFLAEDRSIVEGGSRVMIEQGGS
jgi:lipopolysaccharide export system protein LptA